MYYIKNRAYILFGALLAQVTIAGLYAWSVFGVALQNDLGWTSNATFYPYALAQFVFAVTTLLSGRLVDKKGPRPALLIGGILFSSGLILSSLVKNPIWMLLTYGVLTGAGVGFVYVCPLSTLVKWFPNKKGLVTGLAVGVFGGGSILFKEIITWLLSTYKLSQSFVLLGIVSFIAITIGGLLVNNPKLEKAQVLQKTKEDYEPKEMVGTSRFKMIWLMYWLAVIPGLLILGAAKDIGIIEGGLSEATAGTMITVLALANASSRLISGTLVDRFGITGVLKSVFVLTIVSLLALVYIPGQIIFYLASAGIAAGYGGFLVVFPMLTLKEFGPYRYGSNYGVVFQAYGLAALSGIFIKGLSDGYQLTFIVSAVTSLLGLILLLYYSKPKSIQKKELMKTG